MNNINFRQQTLNININKKSINDCYLDIYNLNSRYQIIYGGSSSGKSYAIFNFVIYWALQGKSILIARKVANTIKKSVFLEVTKAISNAKLSNYFKINKTDGSIISLINKGSITFIGLDNSEKIKSVTPPKSNVFDTIIIEEASEITEDDFQQLSLRQRGKTTYKKKIILLFNPIYKKHWIYNRWFKSLEQDIDFDELDIKHKTDELYILKTTYKNNKFLGKEEINTLEQLKHISPYHYNVYALGRFGILGELVYTNYKIETFNITNINKLEQLYGLDFGYRDPTAFIMTCYDKESSTIYIYDEIYKPGMLNEQIKTEILKKLQLYNINTYITYGDSAEPKSIKMLQNNRINILPTKKGKDSINAGIDFLQTKRIIIHPKCKNLLDELSLYIYDKDTNKPIDAHNHLLDALRYAYNKYWSGSGNVGFRKLSF